MNPSLEKMYCVSWTRADDPETNRLLYEHAEKMLLERFETVTYRNAYSDNDFKKESTLCTLVAAGVPKRLTD